ncbi:hypothetical protein [Vampirovibrio chlorellavorus]|uniref:hypothetical protein n=1 Tax=Vampirovibrio chlorellavorus TaxID=758823 RepID=UPI0026EDF423|nr:hypothetical protein [Vampirovibrio chlorellavorus]
MPGFLSALLGGLLPSQAPAPQENPMVSIFNTLIGTLSGILGFPTGGKNSKGGGDSAISDPATALSVVLGESNEIASADGNSGSVSTADLAMVARNKDGKYSADAQAAAQFLMANQAIWAAIDKMDNNADTKASIQNLSKALSDPKILNASAEDSPGEDKSSDTAEPVDDPATALTDLISEGEDVADADGDSDSISVQDLVIVSRNKDGDFSPEAQAAAKYLLAHQAIWNQIDAMDETKDTKASLENVSKALSDPDILGATSDESSGSGEDLTVTDNATAFDLLDAHYDDIAKLDGDASSVSLLDLSRAARQSKNKELLAVVKYLQGNPEIFKQLAGKDGTKNVSQGDIASALEDPDFMSMTQDQADAQSPSNLSLKDVLIALNDNKTILDTAAEGSEADEKFTKADLQAIAENKDGKYNNKPKLLAAVRAALKNEDLMAALDVRETFSFEDLQTFADGARADENYVLPIKPKFKNAQDAYAVLAKAIQNGTLETGNWSKDGVWTGGLKDGSGKFVDTKIIKAIAEGKLDAPYELKEACKWIVNTPAELQKLEMYENMDGFDDDALQVDLIKALTNGPVEENFGLDVGNQSVISGEDKRKAKEIFARNDNALLRKIDAIQGGNPDGVISNYDMWAAVKDRTGMFTVEEKRAILTVIGGDDGNLDGSIWDNINDGDEIATYGEFFRDIEQ